MAPTVQHLREVMLFHFHQGLTAVDSARILCEVYGPDTIAERTAQMWFQRFNGGNCSVEDLPRSGRPSTVDPDKIIALVDANPHLAVAEVASMLNISVGSVHLHLTQNGYVSRADVWVPHNLNERNMMDRLNTCALLLEKENEQPFLKRLITGDEKWIVYDNVVRQRSWGKAGTEPGTFAKAQLTPNKVMLSIWWDCKGVVYYELLGKNETVDSDKYCQQLECLKAAIAEKRPALANRRGVVFQHDNARPHTSVATCRRLYDFGWDVLPHPPYSPDLAPSDYHLFRALQQSLRGKKFQSSEGVKTHIDHFIESQKEDFWSNGLNNLPTRWRSVIERGGTYIIN